MKGTTLVVETSDGREIYDSKFLVAALLIHVAQGSGKIEPEESSQIIDLIEDYFNLDGSESLELITRAVSEMVDKPTLVDLLMDLSPALSDATKEDIAFMGLKVVAADGRRDVAEMEQFTETMESLGISNEIVHRAFGRYFNQTGASN